MQLRYSFRLYPNGPQRSALAQAFGCARVVFNDALRARETARAAGEAFPRTGDLSRLLITGAKKTDEFERYADDVVLHCVTERQARQVLAALSDRMSEVGLRLHPAKTRIVYCKDGNRRSSYEHTAFTFLGYMFRARKNRSRQGNIFLAVDPAISKDALTRIGREVRGWHLHTRTDLTFQELARWVNPKVAGWINYYGRFRPWELIPFMTRINAYLVRWIRKKYKRLAAKRKALAKLQEIARRYPRMFAHWRLAPTVSAVLV